MCLPYLKFSDLLPKTFSFFLFGQYYTELNHFRKKYLRELAFLIRHGELNFLIKMLHRLCTVMSFYSCHSKKYFNCLLTNLMNTIQNVLLWQQYYHTDICTKAFITFVKKKVIWPWIAHSIPCLEERMFTTKYKSHFSNTLVHLGYHSDHNESLSIHQVQSK